MSDPSALIVSLSSLLDRIVPDSGACNAAKLQLLTLQGTQELQVLQARISSAATQATYSDPWTSRARPSFLYVMYIIILFSLPMGVLAAFRPQMAAAISVGMNSYLEGIPSSLYTLFGTGYLGYTAARQWGKKTGTDK